MAETRATRRLWCCLLPIVLTIGTITGVLPAEAAKLSAENSKLVLLATQQFSNLTKAERSMLWFSDVHNIYRGETALGGSSAGFNDPSNDPAFSNQWGHEREIRACLLRWMCADLSANKLIDPKGIRVLGARVVGGIDLSHIRVPFSLALRKRVISQQISLAATEIVSIDLRGSHVTEIDTSFAVVHGNIDLADGFDASGEVRLESAVIDGNLNCAGGSFHASPVTLSPFAPFDRPALVADQASIRGDVILCCGFRSYGGVLLRYCSIQDIVAFRARFTNPGMPALSLLSSRISGIAFLGGIHRELGEFEAEGRVELTAARISAFVLVDHARFLDGLDTDHGFLPRAWWSTSPSSGRTYG